MKKINKIIMLLLGAMSLFFVSNNNALATPGTLGWIDTYHEPTQEEINLERERLIQNIKEKIRNIKEKINFLLKVEALKNKNYFDKDKPVVVKYNNTSNVDKEAFQIIPVNKRHAKYKTIDDNHQYIMLFKVNHNYTIDDNLDIKIKTIGPRYSKGDDGNFYFTDDQHADANGVRFLNNLNVFIENNNTIDRYGSTGPMSKGDKISFLEKEEYENNHWEYVFMQAEVMSVFLVKNKIKIKKSSLINNSFEYEIAMLDEGRPVKAYYFIGDSKTKNKIYSKVKNEGGGLYKHTFHIELDSNENDDILVKLDLKRYSKSQEIRTILNDKYGENSFSIASIPGYNTFDIEIIE